MFAAGWFDTGDILHILRKLSSLFYLPMLQKLEEIGMGRRAASTFHAGEGRESFLSARTHSLAGGRKGLESKNDLKDAVDLS